MKKEKLLYNKERQDHFFALLRSEANDIVAKTSSKHRNEIVFKAFLFPALYFSCWIVAMLYGAETSAILFTGYFAMGLLVVVNYLNVVHDAVHNTIFKSRRLNELYVYLFDIMGANSFIWKTRHV